MKNWWEFERPERPKSIGLEAKYQLNPTIVSEVKHQLNPAHPSQQRQRDANRRKYELKEFEENRKKKRDLEAKIVLPTAGAVLGAPLLAGAGAGAGTGVLIPTLVRAMSNPWVVATTASLSAPHITESLSNPNSKWRTMDKQGGLERANTVADMVLSGAGVIPTIANLPKLPKLPKLNLPTPAELKVVPKVKSIFNDINTKRIVSRLSNPKIDRFSDSYVDMYLKLKSDIISGRKKLSNNDFDALFKNHVDYGYMKSIKDGTPKKSVKQEFSEEYYKMQDLINIKENKDINHPRFNELKYKLDDDDILQMQSNNAQSQDVADYINGRKQNIYNESLNKSDAGSILFHNYNDKPAPNDFKSELNWIDFVKKNNKSYDINDIKTIKLHKKEYDSIEFQSKNDGTWMKNPDGSDFDGTPYQFIQANSKKFKKAFGETSLRNKSGYPMKLYHGNRTGVEFNEFKPPSELGDKFQLGTMTDKATEHTYFSTGRALADGFNRRMYSNADIPTKEVYANVKSIYVPKSYGILANPKKYGISSNEFDAISMIDRFGKNMEKIYIDEVALPTKRIFPKSALGNNGDFDMTNPNIYKVVIPAAGLYGLPQYKKQDETKLKLEK